MNSRILRQRGKLYGFFGGVRFGAEQGTLKGASRENGENVIGGGGCGTFRIGRGSKMGVVRTASLLKSRSQSQTPGEVVTNFPQMNIHPSFGRCLRILRRVVDVPSTLGRQSLNGADGKK